MFELVGIAAGAEMARGEAILGRGRGLNPGEEAFSKGKSLSLALAKPAERSFLDEELVVPELRD